MAVQAAMLSVLTVAVASWIVLLAAVASVHELIAEVEGAISGLLAAQASGWTQVFAGVVVSDQNLIPDLMGLTWWVVWFEFGVLVAVAVCSVTNRLRQFSQLLMTLLGSLLALLVLETHDAGRAHRAAVGFVPRVRNRMTALFAGAVMSGASTLLLLVWIGVQHTPHSVEGAAVNKQEETARLGTHDGSSSTVQQYIAGATGGSFAELSEAGARHETSVALPPV